MIEDAATPVQRHAERRILRHREVERDHPVEAVQLRSRPGMRTADAVPHVRGLRDVHSDESCLP